MEQKKKIYSTPPLPFRGNKRNFIREFKEVLSGIKDIEVVVDLFGGSGLLSRAAKDVLPHARVIYNDYDNYTQRLENIERTNEIFDLIRPFIEGLKKEQGIPEEKKNKILDLLSENEKKGSSITSLYLQVCFTRGSLQRVSRHSLNINFTITFVKLLSVPKAI